MKNFDSASDTTSRNVSTSLPLQNGLEGRNAHLTSILEKAIETILRLQLAELWESKSSIAS